MKEFRVINGERVRSYSPRRVFNPTATPRSEANAAMDARRLPGGSFTSRCGQHYFLTQRDLSAIRHMREVAYSQIKRQQAAN